MSARRWAVVYLATADHTVMVEAEDESEAIQLAEQQFTSPHPCHMCASEFNLGDWYPDESEYGVTDEGPAPGEGDEQP